MIPKNEVIRIKKRIAKCDRRIEKGKNLQEEKTRKERLLAILEKESVNV